MAARRPALDGSRLVRGSRRRSSASLSLLGAGIGAHFDWLEIARQTSPEGIAPASLPGVLQAFGAPSAVIGLVIPLTLVVGAAVIVVLRDRPGPAFAAAIVTMVLANPAVHDGSYAMLLPALLPLARPIVSAGRSAAESVQRAQSGVATA